MMNCLVCKAKIELLLDYGDMPLAGSHGVPCVEHARYPLKLYHCSNCLHMQVNPDAVPDDIFKQYTYQSGVSSALQQHFDSLAMLLCDYIEPGDVVVDVGCNDGTLIRSLEHYQMRAIGVDPSDVSRRSVPAGQLYNDYMTPATAERIIRDHSSSRPVMAVTACNVLAHTPNVHEMMQGIAMLLDEDGYLIIEVHSQHALLKDCQWDTVYHEHYSYFSLSSLERLLREYGFFLVNAAPINTHSGSLRVVASRRYFVPYPFELHLGHTAEIIALKETFAERAHSSRRLLYDLVVFMSADTLVAIYGAGGRSVLLVNWLHVADRVAVYDDASLRIGKTLPGTSLVVQKPPIRTQYHAYCIVSAWNYFEELRTRQPNYKGRWVKPLPALTIYS